MLLLVALGSRPQPALKLAADVPKVRLRVTTAVALLIFSFV